MRAPKYSMVVHAHLTSSVYSCIKKILKYTPLVLCWWISNVHEWLL